MWAQDSTLAGTSLSLVGRQHRVPQTRTVASGTGRGLVDTMGAFGVQAGVPSQIPFRALASSSIDMAVRPEHARVGMTPRWPTPRFIILSNEDFVIVHYLPSRVATSFAI